MKLTPEQLAEWKDLVPKLLDDSSDHLGITHSTDMPPQHTVNFRHAKNAHEAAWAITKLIADLEEATATRGNGVLVPSPKLKEMQAEIRALRKQLTEAQALLVSGADLLGKVAMNAVDDFVCASGQKYADLMRQADSSALQSSIAEAVEPYRKDAERLDWLMLNVNCDEIEALPKLPFGLSREEHLSAFRAAIDAAIAARKEHP